MVAPGPAELSYWILGDTFIRNFFTGFDYAALTVSFAPSAFAPPAIIWIPPPVGLSMATITWIVGSLVVLPLVIVAIISILKQKDRCFKRKGPEANELLAQNAYE